MANFVPVEVVELVLGEPGLVGGVGVGVEGVEEVGGARVRLGAHRGDELLDHELDQVRPVVADRWAVLEL